MAAWGVADDAAATPFVAGIAVRAGDGVVLWVTARPDLLAPALSQAVVPPARLIQVDARRDEDALAVIEEGLPRQTARLALTEHPIFAIRQCTAERSGLPIACLVRR